MGLSIISMLSPTVWAPTECGYYFEYSEEWGNVNKNFKLKFLGVNNAGAGDRRVPSRLLPAD